MFGTAEIDVTSTPATFWSALRDVGGMVSLLFFFAIFAGCRHTRQFNESLKKAFYRATKYHKQAQIYENELADMSMSSSASMKREIEK